MSKQGLAVTLGLVLAIWFMLYQSLFFLHIPAKDRMSRQIKADNESPNIQKILGQNEVIGLTESGAQATKKLPDGNSTTLTPAARKLIDLFQADKCKHILWENPTVPKALSEGICFTRYSSLRLERYLLDQNRFYIPSSCDPPLYNELCFRRTWYISPPIIESPHLCNNTDERPYIIINRDYPNLENPYHRTTLDFFPLFALLTLIKERSFRGVKLYLVDGLGRENSNEKILYKDIYKMFQFDEIVLIPDRLRDNYMCYTNAICVGSIFNWDLKTDNIPMNGILTDFVDFVVSHIHPFRLRRRPHPSILYLRRTYTRKIKNEDKILEHIRQKYPNVKLDVWDNTPFENIIDEVIFLYLAHGYLPVLNS